MHTISSERWMTFVCWRCSITIVRNEIFFEFVFFRLRFSLSLSLFFSNIPNAFEVFIERLDSMSCNGRFFLFLLKKVLNMFPLAYEIETKENRLRKLAQNESTLILCVLYQVRWRRRQSKWNLEQIFNITVTHQTEIEWKCLTEVSLIVSRQ